LYANDLGGDFDASNITVYVSSNNADYAVVAHNQGNGNGVFPTDGGNISINASTFPGSGAGSNPFTDGINDETVLLYFRFTLTFPDSETSSTSYSKTDWVDYYLSVPEV